MHNDDDDQAGILRTEIERRLDLSPGSAAWRGRLIIRGVYRTPTAFDLLSHVIAATVTLSRTEARIETRLARAET
jgi:hypothetical protein